MCIPTEIQYMIISFIPEGEFRLVCKDWNNEITNIQKEYANIIGLWYKKRKIHEYHIKLSDMVRYYVINYPTEFFISYPESIVRNLGLNNDLLSVLPNQNIRKRSQVRDWMLNMPITMSDLLFVGW